jgi:hypothetical protein
MAIKPYRYRFLSVLAALPLIATNAVAKPLPLAFSDNAAARVFVFGAYVLDLRRAEERWIAGSAAAVRDCSTDRFYCLRSADASIGIANFVIPRRCADVAVGHIFRVNGNVTRVVAVTKGRSDLPPLHGGSASHEIFDLVDDANPNVVFKYSKIDGVSEIVRSTPSKVTISFGPLVTFDRLAPCS